MSQFIGIVINNLNLVNGIIALLCTTIHLIQKRKSAVDYHIALLYFLMGYLVLYFWAFRSGTIYSYPGLIYTDIAVTFAIGPSFYLYILRLSGESDKTTVRSLALFSPALLFLTVLAGMHISGAGITDYFIQNHPQFPRYDISLPIRIFNTIADLTIAVYIFLTVTTILRVMKKKRSGPSRHLMIFVHFLSAQAILMGLLFYGHYLGNDLFIAAISTMIGTTTIVFFIYSQRNPDITHKPIPSSDSGNNRTIDADDPIVVLIIKLIDEQKIYRDENLTLQSMSNQLHVNNYELSKTLRKRTGMNFRTFINFHRLKEAKNLLLDEPEKPILEIAYQVGFNSKTAFNTSFIRKTGISPRDYRTQYLKKRDLPAKDTL
jgi:AraC-like DNA-binding protein